MSQQGSGETFVTSMSDSTRLLVFEQGSVRLPVTIVAGTEHNSSSSLPAGTLLAKVTASGKYGIYDDGASDGTENMADVVVLGESVDATAEIQAQAYHAGHFYADAIVGTNRAAFITNIAEAHSRINLHTRAYPR